MEEKTREFFKFRFGSDDADLRTVLDAMPHGEASQFVKDAIRERIGVKTNSALLRELLEKVERLLSLSEKISG